MNKEEINKLTQKIESCGDENNPGDVRSFDERLKQKLTPEVRDMEYDDVIIHSINLHTLMHVTRILNELIEMIEDGKFNTSENSVSCCGGECGKQ